MRKLLYFAAALSIFSGANSNAQLLKGSTLEEVAINSLVEQVEQGNILILGENHGLKSHQDQQVLILRLLREKGLKVSVGLEFLNYTDQEIIENYKTGALTEEDFLEKVKWGGFPFSFYREQAQFPNYALNEKLLGLNIPRAITSKISKQGLNSLSVEEMQIMPPQFQVGRDSYKERFMLAAGSHCKVPENCFAAQSTWDDTMAWRAVDFMQKNPEHVLVILVGEFHSQYGGGLPDRIRARADEIKVLTLSQIWAEGLSDDELKSEIQVSPVEGPRADFIWISRP